MGLGRKFIATTFPGRGILDVSLASTLEKEIRDERDGNFTSFDVFIPSIPCRNTAMEEGRSTSRGRPQLLHLYDSQYDTQRHFYNIPDRNLD
jgi:hypothetical protein